MRKFKSTVSYNSALQIGHPRVAKNATDRTIQIAVQINPTSFLSSIAMKFPTPIRARMVLVNMLRNGIQAREREEKPLLLKKHSQRIGTLTKV